MAKKKESKLVFNPISENDSKELRKELGLPIYKNIRYMKRISAKAYEEISVVDYSVVDVYYPSNSKSLIVTLQNGEKIRILGDFFADMQKPQFVSDMLGESNDIISPDYNNRGKEVEDFPSDYTVIDLETTGTNYKTDKIIEIGAVKYRGNKEVDFFNEIISIEESIPPVVSALTGITDLLVLTSGVPLIEALTKFVAFIGDDVLIGHNIKTFDSYFLNKAYEEEFSRSFSNDFVDTYYVAKKILPDLESHKLEALSDYYTIDYTNAHRATSDCRINQLVYRNLVGDMTYEEYKLKYLSAIRTSANDVSKKNITKKKNGYEHYGNIKVGEIKADESIEIDMNGYFYGANVVITGDFTDMSREDVYRRLANAGAVNKTSVSSKTDYLIVGNLENVKTASEGKSGKIIKAEELRAKGGKIKILSEDEFFFYLTQQKEEANTEEIIVDENLDIEETYKDQVENAIAEVIREEELLENSIQFTEQDNKFDNEYLLQFFEEEYPHNRFAPNSGVYKPILQVKADRSKAYNNCIQVIMNETQFEAVELPSSVVMVLGTEIKKVRMLKNDPNIKGYIKAHILFKYKNYLSKESFGCCSQHIKCSDTKRCLHQNKLYATGCSYYSHLSEGRIFYGKNRNVD